MHPNRERAFAWLYVVAWIGLVQAFAGDSFSAQGTSRFIRPLLSWLFPAADPDWISTVHFGIRKAGHVVEYAILALLSLRAMYLSFARSLAWHAAGSLLVVLAVAIVDESRQAASEQRTGAMSDVALDFGGAVVALAIACAVVRMRSARA